MHEEHKWWGKKREAVTYSKVGEDEVCKTLYFYCVSDGFGNDPIHEGELQISEAIVLSR